MRLIDRLIGAPCVRLRLRSGAAVLTGLMLSCCHSAVPFSEISTKSEIAEPAASAATELNALSLPRGFKYPNGITAGLDGTLYVGSVTSGDIVALSADGASEVVFRGNEQVFAGTSLRFDALTNLLWVASPDFLGQQHNGRVVRRPHRVAAIDLSRKAVVWSTTMPDEGFGNDFALDGRGGVYLTDSQRGRVLHLAEPGAPFEVVAKDPLLSRGKLGPAGIALRNDGMLIIGLFSDGALLRIIAASDSRPAEVRRLQLARAIQNPDGMAFDEDGRLLVLEGAVESGDGKLLAIDLDQPAPLAVSELVRGIQSPLNLTLHDGTLAITEGRVRHLMVKEDSAPAPTEFKVLKLPLKPASKAARRYARLPAAFFPESIAGDAKGNIYLGSTKIGSIVKVEAASAESKTFVGAGGNGLMSVEGLWVSDEEGILYACTADLGVHSNTKQVADTPTEDAAQRTKNASALTAFRLADGEPAGHWELPAGGFCNDLTQLPDGRLLVSDSYKPRILAFAAKAREPWSVWAENPKLAGAAYNGNGIAWSRFDNAVYLSTFSDGRLIRIAVDGNQRAGAVVEVELPRPLNGGDAVRVLGPGRLVIFENGLIAGGGGQVTSVVVAGNQARFARLHGSASQPTSGLLKGDQLWFADSHFAHLFGADKSVPPGPFALWRLPLPRPMTRPPHAAHR